MTAAVLFLAVLALVIVGAAALSRRTDEVWLDAAANVKRFRP